MLGCGLGLLSGLLPVCLCGFGLQVCVGLPWLESVFFIQGPNIGYPPGGGEPDLQKPSKTFKKQRKRKRIQNRKTTKEKNKAQEEEKHE